MHTLHLAIDFCLLKNFYAGIFQGDTIFRDSFQKYNIFEDTFSFRYTFSFFFIRVSFFSEILGRIAFSVWSTEHRMDWGQG